MLKMENKVKQRILTGIKPTGYPHIGNYFGAIKPAIDMSKNLDYDSFYFIADYHALTTVTTKDLLQEYTKNVACTWLACGLDPKNVVFYKQSDIPEVFELNWILNNVAPKGLLNRAHAYKARVEANEKLKLEADEGINMGLFNYPILMSADILLFGTDIVPVGLDQKQHVEIARDIARTFNNRYGQTFVEPKEFIQEGVATLVGLDGRKMSKSYGNTIQLFTNEKDLQKSVKQVVTDCRLPGEPKDKDCTINLLYKLFVDKNKAMEFEQSLVEGLGWGEAKKQLFAVMNEYIAPMREKFNYYFTHYDEVKDILNAGQQKARKVAHEYLEKVREAIGTGKLNY